MTENINYDNLNDQQRLALYKLGDHIKEEHLNEFGKEAVIVDGISWHTWEKKEEKTGKILEHGMKPKIGVQFPGMPKVYEYRIPATTLKELEAELGPAHESKNWLGAKIKFLPKSDGFHWVDATVISKPEGAAVSEQEADAVVEELEAEAKKGSKK